MEKIIKFVRRYPETIIIGLLAIVLLIVLIKVMNLPEDEDIKKVNTALTDIEATLKDKKSPELKLPEGSDSETVRKFWAELPNVTSEVNNWLMYYKPYYVVEFTKLLPPVLKTILPPTITLTRTISATPDIVILTWQKNPPARDQAPVSGYKIYRKTTAEKEFRLITPTPLIDPSIISTTDNTITWTDDNNIEPETEYEYAITALTDEKAENMAYGKTESELSKSLRAEKTFSNVELRLKVVTPDGDQAWLEVTKYFKGKGKKTASEYFSKGATVKFVSKGDNFSTDYVIKEIIKGEPKDIKTGDEVIHKKVDKAILKNQKTGREIPLETVPY